MIQYKRGDIVYFIRSGKEVIQAQVTGGQGYMYTLRFRGKDLWQYSGIRLPVERLFPTREAAESKVRRIAAVKTERRVLKDTHWDRRYA